MIITTSDFQSQKNCGQYNFSIRYNVYYYILLIFFSITGFGTLITLVCQLFEVPYSIYVLLIIVFTVLTVALIYIKELKNLNLLKVNDKKIIVLFVIFVLCSSYLGLSQQRPDIDDYFYIPNIIYYKENLNEKFNFAVHFFSNCFSTVESIAWGTSMPFDYLRSIPSIVFSTSYFFSYYQFTIIIGSLIIVSTLLLYLSLFNYNPSQQYVMLFFILIFLCFLTDTHRTPGNFCFPRLFQGKAWVLSLLIPTLTVNVIYLVNDFNKKNVWFLFFAVLSFLGMSSSSIFLIPPVLLLAFVTNYIYCRSKITINYIYIILGTMAPIFLYGLFIVLNTKYSLSVNSPINQQWPYTFKGHFAFLFNEKYPFYFIIFILSFILAFYFSFKKDRFSQYVLCWYLISIILFLNPFSSHFLINYITSSNAYWRLFYINPTHIFLILQIYNLSYKNQNTNKLSSVTFLILILALSIFLLSNFKKSILATSSFDNIAKYKIDYQYYRESQSILEIINSGTIFGPIDITSYMIMQTSKIKSASIRKNGLFTWKNKHISENVLSNAISCVEGDDCDIKEFEHFFQMTCIDHLIFNNKYTMTNAMLSILKTNQYDLQKSLDTYSIYTKRNSCEN